VLKSSWPIAIQWRRKAKMSEILRNLHREESGQDLVEYALLAIMISIAAVAIMPTVGSDVSREFSRITVPLT
jgi:pilus assembly protein Flp/PilA